MKWYVRPLVLALPVLLSGCYAAHMMDFDGLIPADITITPAIHSLTVVSRCDLDSANKALSVSLVQIANFNRDSSMAKQVVLGCSDALVESPRFDLYNPVVRRSLSGEFSDPSTGLPWDLVRKIAGDPPKDAVLCFEKGAIDDSLKFSLQDGWLRSYQYVVIVKTFWRLYRLSDFQSKEFSFVDTLSFDVDSPREFSSSPDQGMEFIRYAMYQAGAHTGRRLAPWWTSFQRFYFFIGPLDFTTGAKYLKEGSWREAAEIWRPYCESPKKATAAKACFNMALTCEMANNIPAALDWLNKSEQLGMHPFYIKDYRQQLTARKSETEKLNEQMR